MSITLRQESADGATTKGSALTYSELDNNFIHLLRQGSVTVRGDSGTDQTLGEEDKDSILNFVGSGDISTAISSDSAGDTQVTISYAGVSGIANVVDDTTPQLGGDLDVNGNSIVSTSSGNITIAPNGSGNINLSPTTGNVVIDYATWPAEGTNGYVLSTNGAGTLSWVAQPTAGIANVVEDTTPQLGGNLDGQGNKVEDVELDNYKETIYSLGSTDTPTVDVANGNVQSVTISSGLTLNSLTNVETGQSVTLLISGSGTFSSTNFVFAGGNTTLTTTSVASIFYDGTTYYCSIATDFQ